MRTDPHVSRLMRIAHLSDGLTEISEGLVFLLIAGTAHVLSSPPQALKAWIDASPSIVLLTVLSLPLLLFSVGGVRGVLWLRRTYLLDKVGYVEFEPLNGKQLGIGIGVFVGVLVGIVLLAAALRWFQQVDPAASLFLLVGVFFGVILVWLGRTPRFIVCGVVAVFGAVWLVLSHTSLPAIPMLFCVLVGSSLFISGAFALVRLLLRSAGKPE